MTRKIKNKILNRYINTLNHQPQEKRGNKYLKINIIAVIITDLPLFEEEKQI